MEAYITLLTNNNYASGALVLGHSLRAAQTTRQLAVLITAAVSRPIRDRLAQVYDAVIEIGEIDSRSTKNLQLLGRPELGITLTKIHVFNQTQYSKVVFLDADTLVLRNIDDLFETAANGSLDDKDRNTRFAAAPDAGWPDCFNSGVFVCRPKYEDYVGLIEMAGQHGTFDGGDQGLLNSYFDGWSRGDASNRLPFLYNTTPTSVYSYAPAFQQNKDKLAVIHFIGSFKPWQWLRFADGAVFPRNTSSTDSIDLVQKWWNVFDMFVGGKPSDIHEVTHGYDLPPQSQWDRIGMDRQVHEPEVKKMPHYDGWFQPYVHQGQTQPPPPPPPPPPKVPDLPEPDANRYSPNEGANGVDERQAHHSFQNSESITDRELNPHHLTDYRYRLPITIDSSKDTTAGGAFKAIIPEPIGLPDMYYPNAWDLPEDPRKVYPPLPVMPLVIEDTTNADNTPVPSGKGRPIFPWESSAPNTPRIARTPTRTYYNYAANTEERRRQEELEETKRLEREEKALQYIQLQEHERYERERKKQEAQEQLTGSQAFENFRLVNAWDVDIGVQMSILQKTEKRRPRSRKSSAGGIRKGYGLEDMLAYETRQRQEMYEAELVRKRLEEEDRWQREQEEARIKEEELRQEKLRLTKLAEIRAQQRQRQKEQTSPYAFRNAWDPPNVALTKKKLRIEDEEVGLALPLRRDRRSTLEFGAGGASANGGGLSQSNAAWSGHGASAVAAAAAGETGIAIAAGSRSGRVPRPRDTVSEDMAVEIVQHQAKHSAPSPKQITRASGAASSDASASLLEAHGAVAGRLGTTTTTSAARGSTSSSSITTTKMTAPGSHRFVRTTVTTTIIRRKYVDGAMVSSSSNSSTTGGEKMFEIPARPRSGSYFGEQARRTETINSSKEASRLTTGTTSGSSGNTFTSQCLITSGQSTESKSASTSQHMSTSRQVAESMSTSIEGYGDSRELQHAERTIASSDLCKMGERTTATATMSVMSKFGSRTTSSESSISDVTTSETVHTFVDEGEQKRQGGLSLQIDTKSRAFDRDDEEEDVLEAAERQRLRDIREKNASAAAVEHAMQVLSKYPQATSRYGRPVSSSSTSSTGSRLSAAGVLYANDPNLPRQAALTSASASKGKPPKVHAVRAYNSSEDEDNLVYGEEDMDELEYFGERHTRAALPLGSPYMPSTPLASSSQRYGAFTSGYSSRAGSRAGSRPTTPGPGTPSRLGPGTPKATYKRTFELKQEPNKTTSITKSAQQTAPVDTGFSNYKIEWNWKELLGKKPRHWTAEEGEERYDPYNALSTHGSQVDSDEDDGRRLDSSSESDSEEEETTGRHAKSEGSKGSPLFAAGEDNEFTRESGFVIRGGKIARRRSSMALDRQEL
ncbi:Glycogenin-1 [Gamsiella multidivaricata]|nr:Glycogenin-1 [Gamsiella multidivaricata]